MTGKGGAWPWRSEGKPMKREVGLGSGKVKGVQGGDGDLREARRWWQGERGRENDKGLRGLKGLQVCEATRFLMILPK